MLKDGCETKSYIKDMKLKNINAASTAIAICGVLFLLFGPAYLTFDQELILKSVRENEITDWHSLPYQYAAVAMANLGNNFQVKAQVALYFISIAVFVHRIRLKFFSLKFIALNGFVFSPYIIFTVLTAGKDGLAIAIYSLYITLTLIKTGHEWKKLMAVSVLIFFMIAIREIYVLLFIPLVFIKKYRAKWFIVAVGLAFILHWVANGNEIKRSYMAQYLFVSDIVGIALNENSSSIIKELAELNGDCKKSINIEVLKGLKQSNKVNPGGIWNVDPVFLSEDGLCLTRSYEVYTQIKSLWIRTIKEHPVAYAAERITGYFQLFYRMPDGLISLLKMLLWTPASLVAWGVYLMCSKKTSSDERSIVYGGLLYALGFLIFGIGYDPRYLIVSNLIVGITFTNFLVNRDEKKIHI